MHFKEQAAKFFRNTRFSTKLFDKPIGFSEEFLNVGFVGALQLDDLASNRFPIDEEWDLLYAEFAKVADEEGFAEIAETFRQIATVEAEHERRYLKLLERVTDGTVFIRDNEIWWQCRNCGYTLLAKEAPLKCPACAHPQSFFEPKKENY